MTRASSVLALAFLAGVTGASCGPVQYLAQVGGPAKTALAQAEREGAREHAPFEFTAANEYLTKAREEASRSQFQTAVAYARSAEDYANKARALARERRNERVPEEAQPRKPAARRERRTR